MKAKIPPKLTNKQEKAMAEEINRQIIEREKAWDRAFEAMIAYTLYAHYGFAKRKLLNFRKFFKQEYEELKEKFLMNDTYPAEYELRKIGYDIDKLQKEDEKND